MQKNNSIYFDARWIGNHGIGRFAKEMSESDLLKGQGVNVDGQFGDIFSPLDPLKLTVSMAKHRWFLSPSYNCPAWPASRSLLTLHDLMHIRYPEYASPKNHFYYRYLVRRVCRHAPLVFTVSEYSKREICDWAGIAPEKVVVIYNGVDENFHSNVEPLVSERPYLLYVGDRKPHKNIKGVIEGFARSNLPDDVQLRLSGSVSSQIMKMAQDFGVDDRLVFMGFIPERDLPGVYKGAKALLMPSFYEGFGLPMLEAMAVGTPVLSSNCTAIPEVAGDAAFLVDPYRPDDIAEGINQIVLDDGLRGRLNLLGRKRASTFQWEASRKVLELSLSQLLT